MKHLFILLMAALLLAGCSQSGRQKEGAAEKRSFATEKKIQPMDTLKAEAVFRLLTWKIAGERVAFVTGGTPESFVQVFSYPAGEKLFSGGKTGQGPNEFITKNAGSAKGEELMLYDIMNRRISHLSFTGDTLYINKQFSLYNDAEGMCKPFTFISQLKDDTYLMKIDDPTLSEWELANLKEGKVLDKYPNPVRKSEFSYTPFNFLQATTESGFVAAYRYMDRVEFYSTNGDKIQPIKTYGSATDQAKAEDYNRLKKYYLAVAAHKQCYYCLLSTDGSDAGNVIEVYTADGVCQASYQLAAPVTSITTDADGLIVGYYPDENQTLLYRYQL